MGKTRRRKRRSYWVEASGCAKTQMDERASERGGGREQSVQVFWSFFIWAARPSSSVCFIFCSVVVPKCTQLTRFCASADKGTKAKARSAGHKQFRSSSSTRLRPRVTLFIHPMHLFLPLITIHPFLPPSFTKPICFSLFSCSLGVLFSFGGGVSLFIGSLFP